MKARLEKEVELNTVDEIGVLAEISKIVAEKGISIQAISGWGDETKGVFHFLTDDNLRAVDALRAHKFEPFEVPVVTAEVPHKPGMLNRISTAMKESRINIRHVYATAPLTDARCLLVLSTSDNEKAVVLINEL